MTGIALGTLDVPKISLGDTPILKVSLGETLVWPTPPTLIYLGAYGLIAVEQFDITVPAGATRMGFCMVGAGNVGSTTGQQAGGGGGGGLVWINMDVTAGEVFRVLGVANDGSISLLDMPSFNTLATVTWATAGSANTGGAGGIATVADNFLTGRNATWSASNGGFGGSSNTTARSGGGGGAGGYANGIAGANAGDGFINSPGAPGTNGGGGGGGGSSGSIGGFGGNTHLFGQGNNGTAGTSGGAGVAAGNGGDGSIPTVFTQYKAGAGNPARNTTQVSAAFVVRFGAVDYPAFVAPVTITQVSPS